ncbi:UNVERIFIED_CONTAM: hypothetical protein FKN15_040712 [Acipenser sinensis]
MEFHRKLNKDSLLHAPEFVIKPRSHTVWEKQNVKLHCTVSGWPEPRVTWYKNNVPIEVEAYPGKYKIESRYSVHSLEIYSSAPFVDGRLPPNPGNELSGHPLQGTLFPLHSALTDGLSTTDYGIKFNIHIVEKFAVSFGREGETMSLGCTVIVYPNMKRIQPEIQWYRDGVLLQPSKWVQMHWSGDRATLTLTHLNKEDEGLYTMRVVTKSGYETYSAYVFVRDAEAEVAGAPAAPLDVECLDANKDYVIVTWKQPAVDRGSPILGYFVDRCEVGTTHWSQCNDTPFKFARFPVTGLVEGRSYIFRVRAVNKNGISRPSRVSNPIAAMDPADKARMKGHPSAPWTGQIIVTEEEPAASPAPPYGISVLETVRNSMVLGWKQPKFIGGAEITGYFVDYREVIDGVVGKWHEAHIKPVSERAYRVNDLKENMTYQFQVRAANIAGVGIPSLPSTSFKCEEWTIAVPACHVNDLKESMTYQFQVRAANIAGVGIPSLPSTPFKCEEWTIAVPGPPYDLRCTEVRKNSLVLLWNPPVYTGRSEVNGFYIDIKEAEADEGQWRSVNEKATQKKYMKIKDLKEGDTYVFRVRAQNRAGVGKPSDETEPVLAETRPGTKEVVVDVDDDGVISLIYECSEMTADSKFDWSKNYEDVSDSSRLAMETKGGRSRVVFKDPAIEDLGIYSCVVTETEGVSASYTLDEDELKRLLQISHDHKFPIVPLKSDLAVELLEKGRVRFWLQAEKLSANAVTNFVFNDTEVIHGEKYKMSVDKNTGIIEMIMEKLEDKDEGTFTFQLKDGKAVNQSSLVLIGDVFKKLQKESEFQRQEWFRKQGPHFVEYLGWEVANILKETTIIWYKDEREIMFDDKHDFKEGVCTLLISQISKKDAGIYEVILRDDRGKDKSLLKLVDQGFTDLMNDVFRVIAESATELKIQSTEDGIRLYSFVNYYTEELRVSWHHKQAAIAERNRARVVGGLPDVVTIQEGKSLNLTCNIWGDPVPEVTWLKNEREMVGDDHCILKFESGKFASFTITSVSSADSGKYGILVKNKYGTETGDFTLIVTQAIGEMCMAMYVADAAGNVLETITTDGKSKPATPASSKKRNKYKATEHVKPRVEEIVATEETPNEELSVTEEKGDVPPE